MKPYKYNQSSKKNNSIYAEKLLENGLQNSKIVMSSMKKTTHKKITLKELIFFSLTGGKAKE